MKNCYCLRTSRNIPPTVYGALSFQIPIHNSRRLTLTSAVNQLHTPLFFFSLDDTTVPRETSRP